jgi:hypothetical protein
MLVDYSPFAWRRDPPCAIWMKFHGSRWTDEFHCLNLGVSGFYFVGTKLAVSYIKIRSRVTEHNTSSSTTAPTCVCANSDMTLFISSDK